MGPPKAGKLVREGSGFTGSTGVDLDDEIVRMRIEEAITELDDIEAVRLVPGDNRPVDELHVVVAPDRDPKHTVRDLQSLLLANFGVDVDRRVISVVRLGEDAGKRLRHGQPRVELAGVRIEVRGEQTHVSVELSADGDPVRGQSGPVADGDLVEAACEATLDALTGRLAGARLRLLGATVAMVGTEQVAMASLAASDGRSRDLLTGSAVVRHHEADAAARAVLDATNRLQHTPDSS